MSCVHLCTGKQAPFLPCSWGEGPPGRGGSQCSALLSSRRRFLTYLSQMCL